MADGTPGYGGVLIALLCMWLIDTARKPYREYYETCEMVCPPHSYACDSLDGLKLCEIAKCDVCVRLGTLVCASKEPRCTRHLKKLDSQTETALTAWELCVVLFGCFLLWQCFKHGI